jgi:phosphoribosylformylglycinamidine synthase
VVSGNVSFYNEAGGKSIYPTPIIGVVGVIEGDNHVTIKPEKDNLLLLIGDETNNSLNASQYLKTFHNKVDGEVFAIDWKQEIALQQVLVELIAKGLVKAAHDISDGGLGIALAEMALATKTGLQITIASDTPHVALFGEKPSRAVIAIEKAAYYAVKGEVEAVGLPVTELGVVSGDYLQVATKEKPLINVSIDKLQKAYQNLSRIMEG